MSAGARRAAVGAALYDTVDRGRRTWLAVDVAITLVLLALVALAFWPVYGTPWLFVSVRVRCRRIALSSERPGQGGAGLTVLTAVVAWFVFGGVLTMPSSTIAFVVPTPRTLFGLLMGPVTAWRDMLTLDPPIGETFNLLTVPGIVALVAGLVAITISLRTTVPMLAWLPPAVAYLVGVVVGSQVAFRPFLVGAAFFAIVLLWTSYRRSVTRGSLVQGPARLKPLRMGLGAVSLLAAGALAVAVVPALAGSLERDTVRALMEPPIDLDQYASPLQGFRANATVDKSKILFEVAGAREGDIVRIATLDKYDGLSFRVSTLDDTAVQATTFTRVGQWIDDDTEGEPRVATVSVRGYAGVWTPTLGRTTQIAFDGDRTIALSENFYKPRLGNRVHGRGLREGDSYRLTSVVPTRPSDEEIAAAQAGAFPLPKPSGVPDRVLTLAHTWGDSAATSGAAALELERRLKDGYFSHGQEGEAESLSGHTERRLNILLSDEERMIGDGEQYAVAMALMARELGMPSRVIYGYRMGTGVGITGENVGAWTEVYLQDLGWVVFDPTPPSTRTLEEEKTSEKPKLQPYVENPPPPPLRPQVPPKDEQLPIDPGEPPEQEQRIDWAQIGAIAALTGIPLVTIVVPIALILGLKMRRRARRKNNPIMANRIAGAWSELVDRARDVGKSPSASATRSEQAEALVADFGKVRTASDPIALAKEADWIVFAPGDPTEVTTKEYWRSSAAIKKGMRKSTALPKWLASYLSTKSFRKVK